MTIRLGAAVSKRKTYFISDLLIVFSSLLLINGVSSLSLIRTTTDAPLTTITTDLQCDPGCQVTTTEDGSPDCLCTSFTPTMTFRTRPCPVYEAYCFMIGKVPSPTPYYDSNGCPMPRCIPPTKTSPTTIEMLTTTETPPPSTTYCPEYIIDCYPGCELHIIRYIACELPEFECICPSTTETPLFTFCPTIVADCVSIGCEVSSTPDYDPNGCPIQQCICPTESSPTTTETPTTTEAPPPSTTECIEYYADCMPGCFIHYTKPRVRCEMPEGYCICPSTTGSPTAPPTTPLWCPRSPDDCDLVCSSFLVADEGCPQLDCECTETTPSTTTTSCPEIIADCFPPCESSHTITDFDGCPVYQCICPTTSTSTPVSLSPTPVRCPEYMIPFCDPDCLEMTTGTDGCPFYQCKCFPTPTIFTSTDFVTTTTLPCPEPLCREGCKYVPRTDGKCPGCDCSGITTPNCPEGCPVVTNEDGTLVCSCATTPTPPIVTCPASAVVCTSPDCLVETKGPDGCPHYYCDCPSTTVTTTATETPLMCTELTCPPGCPPVPVPNECPRCDCTYSSTTPITTPPCPQVTCRSGCRYVTLPNGCPGCNCTRPTSTATPTTPPTKTECPRYSCFAGCRYVRSPNGCLVCDCSMVTSTTTSNTATSTIPPTTTTQCIYYSCSAGCIYVRHPNGCLVCDCSMVTSTATSNTATSTIPPTTKTECPRYSCFAGCRYVRQSNGCLVCDCSMVTSTATSTSTTGTSLASEVCPNEVECDDGCEKIFDQNGCYSCQCPHTCDNVKCCKGKKCVLKEVYCIKAPCFPVPTCVKIRNPCSGEPARENCEKKMKIQWTYNAASDTCTEFPYYGCNPSPNTFPTEKKCISKCKAKASECQSCASDCYTLRNPGGCPRCICPNPCKKFSCPKRKKCKVSEMKCKDPPCRTKTYCA